LTDAHLPFNVPHQTQAATNGHLYCIKVAATALKGKSGGIARQRCPRNGTRRDFYIARLRKRPLVNTGKVLRFIVSPETCLMRTTGVAEGFTVKRWLAVCCSCACPCPPQKPFYF